MRTQKISNKKNIVEPDYTKAVKEFLTLKKPNKVMITKLIDVIYLSEDGTIDIKYKVQNPYKEQKQELSAPFLFR